MKKSLFSIPALLLLITPLSYSQVERFDFWSKGPSEYEAIKVGYKKILIDALKLDVQGDRESALRRQLEREFEEDFPKIKYSYFDGGLEECSLTGREFECRIVVAVQMDEVSAWVRQNFGQTGGPSGRVGDLNIALVGDIKSEDDQELMTWLHNGLQRRFGHDIFYSEATVVSNALVSGCTDYERLVEETEKKGESYQRTLQAYRRSLEACRKAANNDLALVIDAIDFQFGQFDQSNNSLLGKVQVKLNFVNLKEGKREPAPPARWVEQVAYGDNEALARGSVRTDLFEAATNYIAQQFNTIVAQVPANGSAGESGVPSDYLVKVIGVDTDTKEGRDKLRFIRTWFMDEYDVRLEADRNQGDAGETIYTFTTDNKIYWDDAIDLLYDGLGLEEYGAKLDIDRNSNLSIAFTELDESQSDVIELSINDKSLKKRIQIESADMVVRRRDPLTGIPMTINEANLTIVNTYRKDLVVLIDPVWSNEQGVREADSFNHAQLLEIKAKSQQKFVLRAPSRYAESVVIDVSCPGATCKAEKQ